MNSWVTVFQFMIGNTLAAIKMTSRSLMQEKWKALQYMALGIFFFVLFTPLKRWENFFITGIDKNL